MSGIRALVVIVGSNWNVEMITTSKQQINPWTDTSLRSGEIGGKYRKSSIWMSAEACSQKDFQFHKHGAQRHHVETYSVSAGEVNTGSGTAVALPTIPCSDLAVRAALVESFCYGNAISVTCATRVRHERSTPNVRSLVCIMSRHQRVFDIENME